MRLWHGCRVRLPDTAPAPDASPPSSVLTSPLPLPPPTRGGEKKPTPAKSTCPASLLHVLVPFVTPVPPPAAERLARILDDLCKAVAARGPGGFLPIPLLLLVWTRIRRASIRIARLAARAAAGKPPIVRRAPRAASQNPASRKPASRLPRRAGWLIGPVPAAGGYASQLQYLLTQPDMVALLEAAPGIDRLLRPLCRMLAVARPKLPPRPTARRPTTRQPPHAPAAPPTHDIPRAIPRDDRPRAARAPPQFLRRSTRPYPA